MCTNRHEKPAPGTDPEPSPAPDGGGDPASRSLTEPAPGPHPVPIPFAEPWQYELRFPCDPRAPRVARTTLRAVLTAHGLAELAYRAELLASELTTNSVRHTKGPASVRLHWLFPVLRVSVWDMGPDLPELRRPHAEADGGRGLAILDLVADRWGGCTIREGPYGPGGKTIWFELALTADPPPPLGDGPELAAGLAGVAGPHTCPRHTPDIGPGGGAALVA
ncbi:ATP-binding protein [Streptomyces sp. NRRL F-5135]|uniref:ATP-binding protein n=1 Tax=Streptomyces sp. NRRL F-5135 TaxID=1463858 RepID=UPI000D1414BF|nr:ATP-binding protein [Streptomyces sp. NRRL F-5135]